MVQLSKRHREGASSDYVCRVSSSQDDALGFLAGLWWGLGAEDRSVPSQHRSPGARMGQSQVDCHLHPDLPDGLVKDGLQTSQGQSAALQIFDCLDLTCGRQSLLVCNRFHPLLPQAVQCATVLSQIQLRSNKDDRNVGRVMVDFWEPLSLHVGERRRRNDTEADEEDISLRV